MSMSSFETNCVVQETMYSTYCRFRVPKLYRYAVRGRWHKIPQRCKTHPRELKFVHKYAPNDTALHRIARPPEETGMKILSAKWEPEDIIEIANMRLQAIQAIVESCPSSTSMTDFLGRTPLHLACMDVSYSMGAVELLLEACPMTSSLQDAFGRTPLHYLVDNNNDVPQPLLEMLIKAFPKAASIHDKDGQTPLSIAAESKERMEAAFETLSASTSTCNTESVTTGA